MDWSYQHIAYILIYLVSAIFLGTLAAYSWRHRVVPGALPFSIMMGITALIALNSCAEIASISLLHKIFWFKARITTMLLEVTFAFYFTCEYAGLGKWLTRGRLLLLHVPILVFTLLTFIPATDQLLWSDFRYDGRIHASYTFPTVMLITYIVLLLFASTVVYIGLLVHMPLHRWSIVIVLAGILVPRAFIPLQVLGVIGFTSVAPLTISYDIVGLMFMLALFRFQIFNVIPLARERVIQHMRDGMLILDMQNRVVETNSAAEILLGRPASRCIGKEVNLALQHSPQLLQAVLAPQAGATIDISAGDVQRCIEVHASTLVDDNTLLPLGRLILLHDVTARKHAQIQLLRQQRALATLQERERIARELHDGLGQVLGYVKMQAQATRVVYARRQDATADEYLTHLISVAQDAHADLHDEVLEVQHTSNGELAFIDSLQRLLQRYSEHYDIHSQLTTPPQWNTKITPAMQVQVIRIVQEALSNARKHAHAHNVHVDLYDRDGQLHVTVEDDGVGFDTAQAENIDEHKYGLRYMRERAMSMAGSIRIQSAPDKGTRVLLLAPLQ
jgi:signal transduction histidine kinase